MIEEVVGLLGASAQGVPAWVAGSAAITAAAGAFIAHWRKANTEERVAEHEMDIKKETALVRQVRELTDELRESRQEIFRMHKEMNEMHETVRNLTLENADLKTHIVRLEAKVEHYQRRCDSCIAAPLQPFQSANLLAQTKKA